MGGAALLDQIIQTGEYAFEAAEKSATADVKGAIEEGRAESGKTHLEAVKEFGWTCGEEVKLCKINIFALYGLFVGFLSIPCDVPFSD